MKLLVLNGPNLNMLGVRERDIYGHQTYEDLVALIRSHCEKNKVDVAFFQSNHEGALVDRIQQAYFDKVDGIVLTGGLLRFPDVLDDITRRCGWIAPVTAYPGEFEQEAMAAGAMRVLTGEEEALTYSGKPVWDGFEDEKE